MSQVYSTEPQVSGRVIIETTHGPLEMQLWCRECPTTTRFFLQLCIDGYYDGMVFHRIIPNFLIQTGTLRLNNNNNGKSSSGYSPGTNEEIEKYRNIFRYSIPGKSRQPFYRANKTANEPLKA